MFPENGGPSRARRPASLAGRVLAAVAAIAALVIGLVFSVFLFAAALVAGVVLFGWIWWKLRRVMKQVRRDPRFSAPAGKGDVIEGEVLREEEQDRHDQR